MSDTSIRDKLADILAANDPRNPWNGDDPNPAPHHSIMIGAVLDEMMKPSEELTDSRPASGYGPAPITARDWRGYQTVLKHIREGGS